MEQLALIFAYTVRLWVVVPAGSPATVAVGPCSHEVALDHVQRWAHARRPGGPVYHLRPATPAEVAEVRAWETKMRYDRDRWLLAA
jgi:hypothetical protein